MSAAPRIWLLLMQHVFVVDSEKFAAQIWSRYPVSQTVLYALAAVEDGAEHLTEGAWHASVGRLVHLLDPRALIQASIRACPETGKPRDRAAVDFEEVVLARMSRGEWR